MNSHKNSFAKNYCVGKSAAVVDFAFRVCCSDEMHLAVDGSLQKPKTIVSLFSKQQRSLAQIPPPSPPPNLSTANQSVELVNTNAAIRLATLFGLMKAVAVAQCRCGGLPLGLICAASLAGVMKSCTSVNFYAYKAKFPACKRAISATEPASCEQHDCFQAASATPLAVGHASRRVSLLIAVSLSPTPAHLQTSSPGRTAFVCCDVDARRCKAALIAQNEKRARRHLSRVHYLHA